jgi:hypothetical protein
VFGDAGAGGVSAGTLAVGMSEPRAVRKCASVTTRGNQCNRLGLYVPGPLGKPLWVGVEEGREPAYCFVHAGVEARKMARALQRGEPPVKGIRDG